MNSKTTMVDETSTKDVKRFSDDEQAVLRAFHRDPGRAISMREIDILLKEQNDKCENIWETLDELLSKEAIYHNSGDSKDQGEPRFRLVRLAA